jgi:hypothetical protein
MPRHIFFHTLHTIGTTVHVLFLLREEEEEPLAATVAFRLSLAGCACVHALWSKEGRKEGRKEGILHPKTSH